MSASNDEFYRYNMYSNFGEIGQTIKTLVQNFQKKAKSHSNIESIGDIKDFVASYPEFKKMSGTVSKHVALVGELSKEVKENCLLDVSECEQNIVCGLEKEIPLTKLQQVLGLPKIAPKDALRLVALYTIRYGREVEKNLDLICRSVKGKNMFLRLDSTFKQDYYFSKSLLLPPAVHHWWVVWVSCYYHLT